MQNTKEEFFDVIETCKKIFNNKLKEYGPSWRVFRRASIIDQIYIKIKRIRQLEESKIDNVGEGVKDAYMAIINYCHIGLIQEELSFTDIPDIDYKKGIELYDKYTDKSWELLEKKNADYGEAWRHMFIESYTDMMLVKLNRVKNLYEIADDDVDNLAVFITSLSDSYYDVMNYAVFALIKLGYKINTKILKDAQKIRESEKGQFIKVQVEEKKLKEENI